MWWSILVKANMAQKKMFLINWVFLSMNLQLMSCLSICELNLRRRVILSSRNIPILKTSSITIGYFKSTNQYIFLRNFMALHFVLVGFQCRKIIFGKRSKITLDSCLNGNFVGVQELYKFR